MGEKSVPDVDLFFFSVQMEVSALSLGLKKSIVKIYRSSCGKTVGQTRDRGRKAVDCLLEN